ncbi:MAG: flippase [Betaproteobacteria bacterium]|nr:flippase [Betaproteobacteria bacterium]
MTAQGSPGPAWLRNLPAFLRRHLESRPAVQAVLANSGWLMAEKVLRMIFGVLVGAWVARYLGPQQFGALAYVLAFVAFFQALSLLGLEGLTVREIAQGPARAGAVLGTVFRLRLGASGLGLFLACGLAWALRPGDADTLLLVAIVAAGMLLQSAEVIDLWFQSQTQSRRAVLARAAAFLLASAARVALVLAAAPLWAFAAVQLLDTGLAALLLARAYRRFPTRDAWIWSPTAARALLTQSWPFLLSALAVITYMRIDQIMLRELAGEREVGIYSAALPFSQAFHFLPVVVCASLLPVLSRLHAEDRGRFYARLQQLFTIFAWSAIALVVALALASHWLVALLLGAAYEQSARVLALHAVTNVFVFLGVAQSQWILIEHRSLIALARTLAGAAANVFANLMLIPRYGALGAAAAAVIAQAVAAVLSNLVLAPQLFRMQVRAFVAPAFRAAP